MKNIKETLICERIKLLFVAYIVTREAVKAENYIVDSIRAQQLSSFLYYCFSTTISVISPPPLIFTEGDTMRLTLVLY